MTLTDLETLVEFHYWATRRVLDAVEPLTADQFTRDLGNSFPSAHEPTLRAVLKRCGERGVDQPVEYTRNGVRQGQPFSQTFQHLVNHGTYHRGQVITMLRQLGVKTVPSTDLIAFYREQQAA